MFEEYQKIISEAMKRVCFSDCAADIVFVQCVCVCFGVGFVKEVFIDVLSSGWGILLVI